MATENKNGYALITGATMGIGYELAKLFAQDCYNLVVVARSQQDLDRIASDFTQQYGISVTPLAFDLLEPNAAFDLYDAVKAKGITVNVLVNNAGQGQYGLFVDEDINRYLDIIQLNINSFTVLTHVYLKEMVARNEGKILQLASIASETPGPYQAVYHATKAYVLSLTEALISELKVNDSAVTITALQPGATNTDFFNKADMQDSKAVQDKSKLSDPAQVAKDGYKALMKGDDKTVSGLKNKIQVAVSNVIPDTMIADQVRRQQEPIDKNTDSK